MLMPDSLPQVLEKYSSAASDSELAELLKSNKNDGLLFFLTAVADETWCEKHMPVIGELITWMRDLLFREEIPRAVAEKAAKAIQPRYGFFEEYLDPNLVCKLRDKSVGLNSFMFQAISLPFFYLIRRECRDKNQIAFEIRNLSFGDFQLVEECILTGDSSIEWKINADVAPRALKLALTWGLPGLAAHCERIFLRDVNDANVLDMLAMTDVYTLLQLRERCLEIINDWNQGVQVASLGERALSLHLLEVTESSLKLFQSLSSFVTTWICGLKVIDDPAAIAIAAGCPRLKGLDLMRTSAYSALLGQIAAKIEDLNVAGCEWMSDASFKEIIRLFSSLRRLNVGSCVHLSALSWGELIKLRALDALSLSRCFQVSDQELKLILNACPRLQELDVSECRQLSAQGFHFIAAANRSFSALAFGRTGITDAALLGIVSKLPTLQRLDLTRCQELSEEGIIESIRLLSALRWVDVSQTAITDSALEQLKASRPLLEIRNS
jgi:F-box/leucine-rich repeat protein 2/20